MAKLWKDICENLAFLGVSALIVAALILGARAAERWLSSRRRVGAARRVSIVGICAAIAGVLYCFDFPLPFLAPGFYKLDFSEVPVLLCGFYLGPSAAVVCEAVKILLKLLLKGTTTAFVGDLANFVIGCTMVLPAVIVYDVKKSRRSAMLGLAVGTLVMAVFGSAFNAVYLLPKFAQLYGMPLEQIVAMGTAINAKITSVTTLVFFAVAPLNVIKGAAVSVLTLLLYKHVARPLFGATAGRKATKG